MKAWVVRRPRPLGEGPLEPADLPVPSPGRGEVRVRVLACGVCRTDLHIVEGDVAAPRLPRVPGHQIVGVVDAVGAGAEGAGVRLGDRVGIPWLRSACGACRLCREGRENLCGKARFTGLTDDGGYSEFAVAPAAFAHPIPPGIPDAEAAPLLCAGAVGFRALRLSGAGSGDRVALWGFGASAHLVLQAARHAGCEVLVFTRSGAHRVHARALGAAWAGGPEDEPPGPARAGIVFAPAGEIVPGALGRLERGGTLILAGIHMTPIPRLPHGLLWHERSLRTVANVARSDVRDFLALAARAPIRAEVRTYPLSEAPRALAALANSEIRGAAVLLAGPGPAIPGSSPGRAAREGRGLRPRRGGTAPSPCPSGRSRRRGPTA